MTTRRADRPSILLLTYDSCRYDVLQAARTPVLDSFAEIRRARSPANFTYAAHHAFFAGILPLCVEPEPFYNRFTRQLFGLAEIGETKVAKDSLLLFSSTENVVCGFRDRGYLTVGAGAMNWFRQESLQRGFDQFAFTGTNAKQQIRFVLDHVRAAAPFFAFINFGETHAPFDYAGKPDTCPVDVRARVIHWPPAELGPVGRDSPAFDHQVRSAEFLDQNLATLLSGVPEQTIVVICGDHGECFGEDGYWGHGFDHPKVSEVPLAIFSLGAPLA